MPSPFLLSVLSQITVIVMNLCSPAFMGPRKHPYPAYIPGNLSQDITGKLSWDWTIKTEGPGKHMVIPGEYFSLPGKMEFSEDLNTKDAGLIMLENWVARLGKGIEPPPLIIEMKGDKVQYEAGERVLITGSFKKYEKGKYIPFNEKLPFSLIYTFPGEEKPFMSSGNGSYELRTDKEGAFCFSPFAPVRQGKYEIQAFFPSQRYSGIYHKITQGKQFRSQAVTFTAVAAPSSKPEQFNDIIELFKKEKSFFHQDEVFERYKQSVILKSTDEDLKKALNEFSYGSKNNLYWGDNAFCCAYSASRVLLFLNSLRFSRDDKIRSLMKGIACGPVMRGFKRGGLLSGEHHGVVVHDCHEQWNKKENLLFDPWPRQKADVFTLDEFRMLYNRECFDWGRCAVIPDPDWIYDHNELISSHYFAFPIFGSAVYWNLEWEAKPFHFKGLDVPGFIPLTLFRRAPSNYFHGNPEDLVTPKGIIITADSPVALEISNSKGERMGLTEKGLPVAEIANTELFIYPKSMDDLLWYMKLPEGAYEVKLRGLAAGTSHLLTGKGDGIIQYYAPVLKKGERASLVLNSEKPGGPLNMPDGTQIAATILAPRKNIIGAIPNEILATGAAIALTVMICVTLILRKKRRVKKSLPPHNENDNQMEAIHSGKIPCSPTPDQVTSGLICPACGRQNDEDSRFCSRCGKTINKAKFCKYCGAELSGEEQERFCRKCGKNLTDGSLR